MGRRKAKKDAEQASDSWSQKDEQVHVVESEGHRLNLSLTAKVDASPDLIFSILTEPDPSHAFRGLKAVLYHRVLEDDHHGKRKIELGHRAIARLLFFSLTFDTHLLTWEDKKAGEIRFELTGSGNKQMKKYDGGWKIAPFSQDAMEARRHGTAGASSTASTKPSWLSNTGKMFARLGKPHHEDFSLVTLEHSIVPRIRLPPGLKVILRRFVAKQAQDMMKDLRLEVDRVKANGLVTSKPVVSKKKDAGQRPPTAPAASITLSRPLHLWDMAVPISL